jgi:hypothetical protein
MGTTTEREEVMAKAREKHARREAVRGKPGPGLLARIKAAIAAAFSAIRQAFAKRPVRR